jgi:hypothetical protein
MIGFLRTLFSSGPPFDDAELAAGYKSIESMPSGSVSGVVIVFQRVGLQLTFALLLALPGLAFLGATLSPYVLWYGRVPAGLACVGVAVLIWRIAGLAIYAGPDDLVIRNVRNTHRIPWSEVEDIFVPPPPSPAIYFETALPKSDRRLLVRLKEGAVISATLYDDRMFDSTRLPNTHQRVRAAEQLNKLRKERTGTGAEVVDEREHDLATDRPQHD